MKQFYHQQKNWTRRLMLVVLGIVFLCSPQVSAQNPGYGNLTPEQLEALGIYFAKGNYGCTDVNGAGASLPPVSGDPAHSGSWNSGLQPPYILEQFMIEVLKDIAQKRGVNPQNTVTQEHVIALVAFARGEGGDIMNHDLFNPLNSGINAPDLIDGAHAGNGVQSFKSFDDGVEATARSMVTTTQRRLSDFLIQPNNTAEDFMKTLTYYDQYPGNLEWAEASKPPHADQYYQERLTLVNDVRHDYAGTAALIIGTPDQEQLKHEYNTSLLQFHPSGESTNGGQNSTTGTDNGQSCACTTNGHQPLIVVDPGHSGQDINQVDPITHIQDHDYRNSPEMEDMWDVAGLVKQGLTNAGYKVELTKTSANDTVSLRARADKANQDGAALAISLHDQAGPIKADGSGGLPFDGSNNHVYIQKNGLYRVATDGSHVTFNNTAVADKSAADGQKFIQARTNAEGHPVDIATANTNGRDGLAAGNIWLVQLFSQVPWIYNEVGGVSTTGTGARKDGLSTEDKQKYANGLIAGVEQSVPIDSATANACGGGNGTWTQTVKAYAWPTYHSAPYLAMTTAYKNAVDAALQRIAKGQNDYVGGGENPGIDCGGFVTRLFRDSNADPKYNEGAGNVVGQFFYLSGHPTLYKRLDGTDKPRSAGDLRKGDIYIQGDLGHTYVFVGPGVFTGYNSASASISSRPPSDPSSSWRAPMASNAYNIGGSTIWFRPLFPVD